MHQSLNEYASFQITAYGTANVLELAKRSLRVVNISTGAAYMARPRKREDILRKIEGWDSFLTKSSAPSSQRSLRCNVMGREI